MEKVWETHVYMRVRDDSTLLLSTNQAQEQQEINKVQQEVNYADLETRDYFEDRYYNFFGHTWF